MKFRDKGSAAVKIGSTKKIELELMLQTVESFSILKDHCIISGVCCSKTVYIHFTTTTRLANM